MWCSDCTFDPVRDLNPVEQFGFVDLKSALANSCVPSVMDGADVDYNGADDPEEVLGTPRDVFEAIDMQNAILDSANVDSSDGEKSE